MVDGLMLRAPGGHGGGAVLMLLREMLPQLVMMMPPLYRRGLWCTVACRMC